MDPPVAAPAADRGECSFGELPPASGCRRTDRRGSGPVVRGARAGLVLRRRDLDGLFATMEPPSRRVRVSVLLARPADVSVETR